MPTESSKLRVLSSVYSVGIHPLAVSAALSWGLKLVCVADRKWHGRGEALSARGAGTGTVPHGLRLPLPPRFLSPSRVQMHIHLL